jgi:hypothetical protein
MTKEEVLAKLKFDVEIRGLSNIPWLNTIRKLKSFRNTLLSLLLSWAYRILDSFFIISLL